mmetsp:Transcript_96921/g.312388  ORF Transcript_96921/g.312388 Transcript_96921/m.312388 type:complete len:386 (+) Transcript_96921:2-1159(+)
MLRGGSSVTLDDDKPLHHGIVRFPASKQHRLRRTETLHSSCAHDLRDLGHELVIVPVLLQGAHAVLLDVFEDRLQLRVVGQIVELARLAELRGLALDGRVVHGNILQVAAHDIVCFLRCCLQVVGLHRELFAAVNEPDDEAAGALQRLAFLSSWWHDHGLLAVELRLGLQAPDDDHISRRPSPWGAHHSATATATTRSRLLATNAAGTAAAEGRGQREVNVLLAVQAHEEGGDVANLLANANVPLADQGPCVVDGLRQAKLEHLGLQAALHDLRGREAEHVVELLLGLEQQAEPNHAAQQGIALEHSLLALLVEGEQRTGCSPDLGQGEVDTPHLALVLQAVLADDLHLRVQALLLERALWLTEALAIVDVALLTHGCSRGDFVW